MLPPPPRVEGRKLHLSLLVAECSVQAAPSLQEGGIERLLLVLVKAEIPTLLDKCDKLRQESLSCLRHIRASK